MHLLSVFFLKAKLSISITLFIRIPLGAFCHFHLETVIKIKFIIRKDLNCHTSVFWQAESEMRWESCNRNKPHRTLFFFFFFCKNILFQVKEKCDSRHVTRRFDILKDRRLNSGCFISSCPADLWSLGRSRDQSTRLQGPWEGTHCCFVSQIV